MKKFYALMAAGMLLATPLSAKELSFSMGKNQTPIDNGAKVELTEIEIDDNGDGTFWFMMDPEIYLTSSESASNVKVTAKNLSGHSIMLCAGGSCEQGENVTKENVSLSADKPLNIHFDYTDDGVTKVPTNVVTEISAQYAGDAASLVKFTITMNPEEGNSVMIVNGTPALIFNGNSLVYNLEGKGVISFYTSDGRVLSSRTLAGAGSINLSNMPKGLVIYSLQGTVNRTGKFIVK